MRGLFRFIIVAAISLTQTVAALSALENKKHHETKHWHCYGFLPGFTPREMLERKREREAHYYHLYGPHITAPPGRVSFGGAGMVADLVRVGRRRLLGRCGTVVDNSSALQFSSAIPNY